AARAGARRRSDAVHALAGRVRGVVVALHGADRRGGRDGRGGANPRGGRRPDRLLCKPTGAAYQSFRRANVPGVVGPSATGVPGRIRASGGAIRARGGSVATRKGTGPASALSGEVSLPERSHAGP